MSRKNLLEVDEDASLDLSFKVNKDFAKKYEEKKRKEELGQLEDKYKAQLKKKGILEKVQQQRAKDGKDESDWESESDSESDEEEDEEGELLTPAVDAQILKTLSVIRARDPKVYDSQVKFFDESEVAKMEEEWKKKNPKKLEKKEEKKVTLKDYQRERLLSGAMNIEDEEEEQDEFEEEDQPMTFTEEQEQIKAEMRKAFGAESENEGGNEEGEGGMFLKRREKSEAEIAREEEEYRNFLLENLANSANARESMSEWLKYRDEQDGTSGKKKGKNNKKDGKEFTNDEEFLIDYVLNKGWVDKTETKVPSYDEIIEEVEEDEEAVEEAEEFEMAHNFRYEQEGAAQIQTYSRKIEGSMRREDNSRKLQRQSALERKEADKVRKTEELKRLKNLKMQEIQEKLEKIKQIAKVKEIDEDIVEELGDSEDEFDPVKHDKMMKKLLAEENEEDDEKPTFSSDSELEDLEEELGKAKSVKKAKKAIKKATKEDSATGQAAKVLLESLDSLNYEDLIGDLPCRFKYQSVQPTTFGLTVDDILAADDTDLNKYISLKKLAPYRPSDKQRDDEKKYGDKRRAYQFRKDLKEKLEKGNDFDNNEKKKARKY